LSYETHDSVQQLTRTIEYFFASFDAACLRDEKAMEILAIIIDHKRTQEEASEHHKPTH